MNTDGEGLGELLVVCCWLLGGMGGEGGEVWRFTVHGLDEDRRWTITADDDGGRFWDGGEGRRPRMGRDLYLGMRGRLFWGKLGSCEKQGGRE